MGTRDACPSLRPNRAKPGAIKASIPSTVKGHGSLTVSKQTPFRAALIRKYQVLSGPIPHILHEKIRKSTKDSRIFSFCLNEIWLAQNCFAPQKVRFRCQTRRKAQKYLCVFRAFSTKYGSERSFLRLVLPYQGRPFRGGVFARKLRRSPLRITGASTKRRGVACIVSSALLF